MFAQQNRGSVILWRLSLPLTYTAFFMGRLVSLSLYSLKMFIHFNTLINSATRNGSYMTNSPKRRASWDLSSELLLHHHPASNFTIQPKLCTLAQSTMRPGYKRTE